jgi:uncharacterized repeat protein (TIGR02543 family)
MQTRKHIKRHWAKSRIPAKILALILSVAMLLGLAVTAAAATYPDISGHWGEAAIEKWSGYDVLHGTDLGTFNPDGELDISQLSQILVNTFGYTASYEGSLPGYESAWGESVVRKAVAAGAIESIEAGLPLTRELAAKIIAKAFAIAPVSGSSKFTDDSSISPEYKPYVAAVGKAGIFNGTGSGAFTPYGVFSRAEIMQALDNAVTDIVKANKAAESPKSVIINKGGVTLGEGTVEGDVVIAQGVGDGDITLDGVTVKGRLVILGGGANSIHVKGKSNIASVVVNKTFGAAARFVVESADASVGTVTIIAESKATVATTNGASIDKVEVAPALEVNADGAVTQTAATAATTVTISAKVTEVNVAVENAALTLSSGAAVDSLVVEEKATVAVSSGATVKEATIEASDVKLTGSGKVTAVTVTEDAKSGVEVKTSGTKITVDSGAGSVATSTGTAKPGETTQPSTGSNNSNNNDNFFPVSPTTYTVTFNSQGGTAVASVNVTSGSTITLPANPTRTGYTFAGWFTTANDDGTAFTATTQVTANITVYAKWTAIEYEITYNLDGGTSPVTGNPDTYTIESAAITLANPTKTGYTFVTWYANAEFTGDPVTTIPAGSTGDITFYAKWTTATSYTITYELDDGENHADNPETYTVESGAITLAAPTKTGYTFGGWYDNENLTGTPVTVIPAGSTGNKTVYANWTAIEYEITYELNSGTNASNNPATYTIESEAITLANPTRDGYKFVNWYDNTAFTGTPVTAIPAGSTGDRTFYAKWAAIEVAITSIKEATAADQTNNNGKYTFGTMTDENDKVTVFSVKESETLNSYISSDPQQTGESQWIGVLITLNKPIVGVQVQTPNMKAANNKWSPLGEEDITDAAGAGATTGDTHTFIWWIRSETIGTTLAKISVRDNESGPVKTLTVVNDEFARPEETDDTATYQITNYDDTTGVALLKTTDGTPVDTAYLVTDEPVKNIFKAVYEPNKSLDGAVGLFHITLGAEDANADIIELKGENVPTGNINIGLPPEGTTLVDNSSLPDFIIKPGALGDGNNEKGSILVVNNGAYLDIKSDQTVAHAFSGQGTTPTPGKLKSGSVYVMAGGKVRDSAYKAWPLGDGSVFTVYAGGSLAVGPGKRDGTFADARLEDGDYKNRMESYYTGWLIGTSENSGKVTFDNTRDEGISDPCIVVTNTSVILKGSATVNTNISLMYDLWLTVGAKLTVTSDMTVTFIHGQYDNQGTPKAIYGQPGAVGGDGDGHDTTTLGPSKVIVNGTIISEDSSTSLFGESTGQDISSKTYTATNTGTKVESAPVPGYGDFYPSWAEVAEGPNE